MNILHLPRDLYGSIQECTDINFLLDSSKKLKNIKHELYNWKLNKEYSLKYYDFVEFRDTVNNKMHKTSNQL